MLHNNQVNLEGKVAVFLLSTGNEVIAKVEQENDRNFHITNPRQFIVQGDSLGLGNVMLSAMKDAVVVMQKKNILMSTLVEKEIEKQYISSVSNIEIVPSITNPPKLP